ncbi:MAG: hypothetical protein LBV79_02750 [Candidatus Adiutrix sp.]|nr:hypothetical protein [Candidatus Adiutrix sp.]
MPRFLLCLFAAVFAAACAGPPRPPSMFGDIPLPPELTLSEKDSRVFEHEIGRVGLLKASGRLSRENVLNFYRQGMAQNGWSEAGEFDSGASRMLVFSKTPRSAAVTVTEGWMSTDVEINVSAKKE